MLEEFLLHTIYIEGTRMIKYGVDALSQGISSEGLMIGTSLLSYIPLHLSALDRIKLFIERVESL